MSKPVRVGTNIIPSIFKMLSLALPLVLTCDSVILLHSFFATAMSKFVARGVLYASLSSLALALSLSSLTSIIIVIGLTLKAISSLLLG